MWPSPCSPVTNVLRVRRDDGPRLVGRTVVELEDVVERVGEPDHALDASLGELLGGGGLDLDAVVLEVVDRRRRARGGRRPPSPCSCSRSCVRRDDDDAGGELVHAEVEVLRVRAASLGEAEDLAAEVAPLVEVGALDPDVARANGCRWSCQACSVGSCASTTAFAVLGEEAAGDGVERPPLPRSVPSGRSCGNTCSDALGISLSARKAPSTGLTRSSRPQVSSVRCADLVGLAPQHALLVACPGP